MGIAAICRLAITVAAGDYDQSTASSSSVGATVEVYALGTAQSG